MPIGRSLALSMVLLATAAPGLLALRHAAKQGVARRAVVRFAAARDSGGGRASAAVVQQAERQTGPREALDLNPPRGTRDFYPEEMRLQRWLFDHWRSVAREFGFVEYDAPVLENEALYVRKAGEEVTQQLYNFEDKGGRAVALRPEMTPSLARMVMARRGGLPLPLKWFSIPQCWRYERTTRGRRREHYQWNMDVWGVDGPQAEAELLAAKVAFFKRVGLTAADVGIKVNSRAVLAEIMAKLGVPEDKFAPACVLVDKLEKVPLEAILPDFEAIGMQEATVQALVSVMALDNVGDLEAELGSDSQAAVHLRALFDLADAYGFADWLEFDASVVRGLSYYTGVVFEAFDRDGELRAISGGGRYDKLLETFGGEALPAAGFGFGDAVVVELLKSRGLLPEFAQPEFDVVVAGFNAELFPAAVKVASQLRQAGGSVDLVLEPKKPKWVFKHADRLGARFVVMVAPKEWEADQVRVKDLRASEEKDVPVTELPTWAQSALAEK